jgi:amidohydrolase
MKKLIEELKPTIYSLFDHFHQHPEISWKEYKTTEYIRDFLQKQGFSVQTFDDCTGLVSEVGTGDRCVALRTDMDALWQEVNGTFQANHSCGHDAHMAMAIGTMLLLKKIGFPPNAKLKFIFQPAEEKGTGALKMLEKKVLDDVDYLYGVHLRPIQELEDGYASPAILHGAGMFLSGEIKGEDVHAARPHLGANSIEIGASIIQHIQGIHLDPMVPHSAKMTKFQAGGAASNIIPGKASFSLDLRAQTNEVLEQLASKIEAAIASLAKLHGVEIELETNGHTAAAKADQTAIRLMRKAIVETLGEDQLEDPIVTSGGEDFHFYTLKKPNIKGTMLGLGCGLEPGLHHPDMTFNREAMLSGVEILARVIVKTLEGGFRQ